jgi:hypothetical protein
MKKIFALMAVVVFLAACNNGTGTSTVDSTATDSTMVDSVAVDSVAVDTTVVAE